MRRGRGFAALTLLVSCVTLGTCFYPTEDDASVHVSITPLHVLLRGSEVLRHATAWQILSATDSQAIPNVRFVWSSSNALVASVDNEGHIIGIKSGTVTITAAAANFDKQARPGRDTVRVSAALEIDSVTPDTVKYGQRLSIFGVGVDSIFAASLGSANLIRVPFASTNYANGTARIEYWVPPPAVTDSLFFIGVANGGGVFGFVHTGATRVIEHDLYDPNVTTPRRLSLAGPGPFPAQLPSLLFWNPALAFEALPLGDTASADWYRFGLAPPHNLTVIFESPELAGTYFTVLSDSLGWNPTTKRYFIGKGSWTFGPGSHACHGLRFDPPELLGDSTIVAFKGLTLDSLDVIGVYTHPGRYGLRVDSGYVSELPPDAHEDDNSCNAADVRDTMPVPFRDTLAIENPHDIDWIRFKAPTPPVGGGVEFRLHAVTGVHPDSTKLLTLYVIKVPASTDTALAVVLADTAVTQPLDRDTILSTLTPGSDYYTVVLDFAGTTTYYELCVQTAATLVPVAGSPCKGTAWPAPPAAPRMARLRPSRQSLPGLQSGPKVRHGRSRRLARPLQLGPQ